MRRTHRRSSVRGTRLSPTWASRSGGSGSRAYHPVTGPPIAIAVEEPGLARRKPASEVNVSTHFDGKPALLQPQASATASATQLRLTEFEQIEAVFQGWQGRIEQISSGSFDGAMQVVLGDGLRAVSARGNQRLRVHGRDDAGMLAIYPICERMARFQWNGTRLEPGQLFVVGKDDETDITSDRRFSGQVVFLSPDKLQAAVRVTQGREEPGRLVSSGVCTPSAEMFAEFERRLSRLFQLADATASAIDSPESRQREQHSLLALAAAMTPRMEPAKLSAVGRARLLSRARELLHSHLDGRLGTIDLCTALNASDRTLRLAFLEQYGIGPMTYYRFLRLNAVRSRLRAEPETTIAEVAREFGFFHLGNFAAQYRQLFGCRPSAIRRP